MASLCDNITTLKGVGARRAELFQKLGVRTLGDLLRYYPRDYEDRRTVRQLCDVRAGDNCCIEGSLTEPPRLSRTGGGKTLVRFRVTDGTGSVIVTFFNQPWAAKTFKTDATYLFFGKFTVGMGWALELVSPQHAPEGSEAKLGIGKLLPVYPLTAGLTRQHVIESIEQALKVTQPNEPLPTSIRERFSLMDSRTSVHNIHFPADEQTLEQAKTRLIFEELFILTLGLRSMKAARRDDGIPIHQCSMTEFHMKLPFSMTNAQLRCTGEIIADLSSGRPMNRLLQGDVGSGKTAVAAAAAYCVAQSGHQTALMAPTELLATQHLRSLTPLFEALGLRCDLLLGKTSVPKKREILDKLKSGELDIVIGTHALITDKVEFKSLGLVITDEQHRFGVRQRTALSAKGEGAHVLVMSATPIPRTLALITYGDLDVSVIDELPPGRKIVKTYQISEDKRIRLWNFVRKLVAEGRQAFIVCPQIDDSEDAEADRKAVESYAKKLSERIFPDLRVELIHGRMKPQERDNVMQKFASGEADVLVATTVIEVGIDIPNAALMIVENAERFGLSQLHQLRGRVGRGSHESFCVLIPNSDAEATRERLNAMCDTTDGFKIAEYDLSIRGPGDFFGSRQHGLPELRIASLAQNLELLHHAAAAANELLASDPKLAANENQPLKAAIAAMFAENAMN